VSWLSWAPVPPNTECGNPAESIHMRRSGGVQRFGGSSPEVVMRDLTIERGRAGSHSTWGEEPLLGNIHHSLPSCFGLDYRRLRVDA
jgi:hypothetical protein